jgi:GrpB-like predicted nucleotidyltransferase (UPF0157 family)
VRQDGEVVQRSDEELAEISVGVPVPHDGPIVLAPYDPTWPATFEQVARRIRAALGPGVLQLEHVGSTSVPELVAKPIIDVLLVVEDPADEDAYAALMEAAGFALRIREPDFWEHRLFRGTDPATNVHVFGPASGPEIERMLAFRDRLRTVPADRLEYERAKQALAARTWRHVQHYADAKSEVVEAIIARALASPSFG